MDERFHVDLAEKVAYRCSCGFSISDHPHDCPECFQRLELRCPEGHRVRHDSAGCVEASCRYNYVVAGRG